MLRFLKEEQVRKIREAYQTPAYVYDVRSIRKSSAELKAFPNAYGVTIRYAMKANPNAAILKLLDSEGLHIDASSGFEVERALLAGIPADKISLSSQEWPKNFQKIFDLGVKFNACSLHQLEQFGRFFEGHPVGVRFNPGIGSGSSAKTNVGGPASSFGIWHESLKAVQEIVAQHNLIVERIHTHIGSGTDPEVWKTAANLSLKVVEQFPDVTILNLGGGFKVDRMNLAKRTDLQSIGLPVKEAFELFQQQTGRVLHLEIEPGTYLMANSGSLVTTVQDIVSTGPSGYTFLKIDAGMTEILRPGLYGDQHPIIRVADTERMQQNKQAYVVVGHCCESGDLLTCAEGDPEVLAPIELEEVQINDLIVIEGSGAYCSSMSAKNYNSFPEATEVLIDDQGQLQLIRNRQTLQQMLANELS